MSRVKFSLVILVALIVFAFSCSSADASLVTSSATATIGDIYVSLSAPNAIIDAPEFGQYAGFPSAHAEAWQGGSLVSSKFIHDVIGSVTTTAGTATATAGTYETWPVEKINLSSNAFGLRTDSAAWSVILVQAESRDGAKASTSMFHRVAFYTVAPVTVTFTMPYNLLSTGNSSAWVWDNLYSGWIGSNVNSNAYAESSGNGSGSLSVSLDYVSGQVGFFTYYIGTQAGAGEVPIPPTIFLLGSGLVGLVGFGKRFMKK